MGGAPTPKRVPLVLHALQYFLEKSSQGYCNLHANFALNMRDELRKRASRTPFALDFFRAGAAPAHGLKFAVCDFQAGAAQCTLRTTVAQAAIRLSCYRVDRGGCELKAKPNFGVHFPARKVAFPPHVVDINADLCAWATNQASFLSVFQHRPCRSTQRKKCRKPSAFAHRPHQSPQRTSRTQRITKAPSFRTSSTPIPAICAGPHLSSCFFCSFFLSFFCSFFLSFFLSLANSLVYLCSQTPLNTSRAACSTKLLCNLLVQLAWQNSRVSSPGILF